MTPEAMIERLNKVKKALTTGIKNDVKEIVLNDLMAAAIRRIQESGELADGGKENYSTSPALVGYPSDSLQQNYKAMYRKAYEQAKKNAAAKWATVNGHRLVEVPGGYKQIREAGGYESGFIDFTVSGAMFRSCRIKQTVVSPGKVDIIYGPTGARNIKIMAAHNERIGEMLLMPSKEEIKQATNRLARMITRNLNDAVNGK